MKCWCDFAFEGDVHSLALTRKPHLVCLFLPLFCPPPSCLRCHRRSRCWERSWLFGKRCWARITWMLLNPLWTLLFSTTKRCVQLIYSATTCWWSVWYAWHTRKLHRSRMGQAAQLEVSFIYLFLYTKYTLIYFFAYSLIYLFIHLFIIYLITPHLFIFSFFFTRSNQ